MLLNPLAAAYAGQGHGDQAKEKNYAVNTARTVMESIVSGRLKLRMLHERDDDVGFLRA